MKYTSRGCALRYYELVCKWDGEPALRSVREDVKRHRQAPRRLEKQMSGTAPRAELLRRRCRRWVSRLSVIKPGLESRRGACVNGSQAVMLWMMDEVLGLHLSAEGRTPYDRCKCTEGEARDRRVWREGAPPPSLAPLRAPTNTCLLHRCWVFR